MSDVQVTKHAQQRMAERGWSQRDLLLAIASNDPNVVTQHVIKVITVLPKKKDKKQAKQAKEAKQAKKAAKQAAEQAQEAQQPVNLRMSTTYLDILEDRAARDAEAIDTVFSEWCQQFGLDLL